MNKNEKIQPRSYSFALSIVKFCRFLEDNKVDRVIIKQLLRAGTSIGANVEEAYGTPAGKDFINKMHIALKEARETNYWLRIINDTELISSNDLSEILAESEEIKNILAQIIITAKKRLENLQKQS